MNFNNFNDEWKAFITDTCKERIIVPILEKTNSAANFDLNTFSMPYKSMFIEFPSLIANETHINDVCIFIEDVTTSNNVEYEMGAFTLDGDRPISIIFNIEILSDQNSMKLAFIDRDHKDVPKEQRVLANIAIELLCYLCELLKNSKDIAHAKLSRPKQKIKIGREKRFIRPKYTIITTKANQQAVNKYIGKSLDWSYSFKVRGHWRRLNGLGKDRLGNYCIKGLTWVKEHIRGDGELQSNTKIIKGV